MTIISPLSGPLGAQGFPDLLGYSQTTPYLCFLSDVLKQLPRTILDVLFPLSRRLFSQILIAFSPLQVADVTFREKSSLTILSKIEIPFNFFLKFFLYFIVLHRTELYVDLYCVSICVSRVSCPRKAELLHIFFFILFSEVATQRYQR